VLNCLPTVGGKPNPLADVRVRRALTMSIDRRPIVENVTKAGEPAAYDYIPPGVFADYPSPPGLAYDVDAARKLMAEAGYPGGKGFPLLTLTYNPELVQHADIALIVRNQWQENLGIKVDAQAIEVRMHGYRLHAHDFEVARASWIGDYPDPTTFTDKFKSDNDNNDGCYSNPKYDALCTAAETQTDPKERMKTFAKAENMLLEEGALIPIYYFVDAYMFRSTVHGVELDPRDMVMFQAFSR
jgi:oligopeptide transport system substrate-binding protein